MYFFPTINVNLIRSELKQLFLPSPLLSTGLLCMLGKVMLFKIVFLDNSNLCPPGKLSLRFTKRYFGGRYTVVIKYSVSIQMYSNHIVPGGKFSLSQGLW